MRLAPAALVLLIAVNAPARPADVEIEVEVAGVGIDVESGSPVVRLVEKRVAEAPGRRARELPIWIGPFEAQAIALEIAGAPTPPRPMTHDLMGALVERLGARVRRIVVDDLRDGTFFATVHLDGPRGRGLTVDARPSDAIALALRLGAPMHVVDRLFGRVVMPGAPDLVRLWGLTLQDLTPEIAIFFDVPTGDGVLVADVARRAAAHTMRRGDVILALDGRAVATVAELRAGADDRPGGEAVHLSVRRGGREIEVTFPDE